MADNAEVIRSKDDNPNLLKDVLSFIHNFWLKVPLVNQERKAAPVVKDETKASFLFGKRESENINEKTDVVKFADKRPIAPPPLKIEAEEPEPTSSAIVRWQVYALGGFLVLRWVWARWKERQERGAKKESSDDNQPPADDEDSYFA